MITLSGTACTEVGLLFLTTDLSCGGDEFPLYVIEGSFAIGEAFPATLDGGLVPVYAFDHTDWTATIYDIAGLDAAQTPKRLYVGDKTVANPGTTPGTRPTELDPVFFAFDAEATSFIAALQGTWRKCAFDGTTDVSRSYTFNGAIMSYATHACTTADGTCGGACTPVGSSATGYAILPGIGATLGSGGPTVSAYPVDYVFIDGHSLYELHYVDGTTTPNRLYTGDLTTGTGASTATRPTRLDDAAWYSKL